MKTCHSHVSLCDAIHNEHAHVYFVTPSVINVYQHALILDKIEKYSDARNDLLRKTFKIFHKQENIYIWSNTLNDKPKSERLSID